MTRSDVLQLEKLRLVLGEKPVVDGVSATLGSHQWTAIVGPNGAGKSSLLSLMSGLRQPDDGRVLMNGRPLRTTPSSARARHIAWLAQQGESEGDLAARDVVALGRLPHHGLMGAPGPDDDRAVKAAMRETECDGFADRRLNELSGGERQRVLLARALAVESSILLLDEPTAHLDVPHQTALVESVSRRARSGAAVAMVLHDLTLALSADRVWVMSEGRLLCTASSDDPDLHRILVDVFEGSFAIERLEREQGLQHVIRPILGRQR